MASSAGRLVTEVFDHDGGRRVTAFAPARPPEAIVIAGDGELVAPWGAHAEAAGGPAVVVVGVHHAADETRRLHDYSPGFDPVRFAAHEEFVMTDVRHWAGERWGEFPVERTGVFGASAGGELALALGLRHPDVFGAVLCASPGAGLRPPVPLPSVLPRAYLVAGSDEPFFLDNAVRWADALREAGAEVVMTERPGGHADPFWREELPRMLSWAFG